MKRRSFFKLFAGIAVGTLPGAAAMARRGDRVAVVGGGIVGASIAYHLSLRGADVTVLERNRPASGTTEKSFAWVNAHFSKQPRHYHRLNRLSTLAYRHLENELSGELDVQWGGALEWFGDPERAARLRSRVRQMQQWGYPARLVDEEEFRELESHVIPGPVLAASYSELDGNVDPVQATEILLSKARQAGARVEYPCEVTELDLRWGRLRGVQTTTGSFAADLLVIACGVDTPKVAAMAGLEVPLKHAPGLLAHTSPQPPLIHRIVVAPGVHMKQMRDGRIVVGEQDGPPDDETHVHLDPGPQGQEFPDEATMEIHGDRIQVDAMEFLPEIEKAQVNRVTLGWRPLPVDGYPVIGFSDSSPNIYLAVMHSGVTLAPLVGRLAALEMLDGVAVDLLAPYRLSRFEPGAASAPH